jgi:hypothetical protein
VSKNENYVHWRFFCDDECLATTAQNIMLAAPDGSGLGLSFEGNLLIVSVRRSKAAIVFERLSAIKGLPEFILSDLSPKSHPVMSRVPG